MAVHTQRAFLAPSSNSTANVSLFEHFSEFFHQLAKNSCLADLHAHMVLAGHDHFAGSATNSLQNVGLPRWHNPRGSEANPLQHACTELSQLSDRQGPSLSLLGCALHGN